MLKQNEVLKHFNNISTNYDENNEKLYWQLADKLLWNIITNWLPKNKKFSFLDLGGGTGTWSKLILDNYPLANGILVDFSDGMLQEARKKLSKYENRIKIIKADINEVAIDESFDLIFNIYLLPFFGNLEKLTSFISKHLKINGIVLSVAENYYNGLALNILKGNIGNIKEMEECGLGKLSETVPKLKFHTIEEISQIYNENNIDVKKVYGYPVVSSIGYSESLTFENNSLSKILNLNFDLIYEIELRYIDKEILANRGKYICVVGEKK